jgi:phage terminase large subunit GpA-like protein
MIPAEVYAAFRWPEKITVSQWAERSRVLVGASSAEPGPWRNTRTPYLAGIMDALTEPGVESITIRKGSQLGGSEVLFNYLGYIIDQDPAPTLVVYPTLDLARSVSAGRIQPMILASDTLRVKIPRNADDFALQEMRFPGMALYLSGANSPASLASRPCRFVFFDEIDKFPTWVGSEADPISLARERQKTFWNRVTISVSTPTVETGPVMREEAICDERRWYLVPCPHCGAFQRLSFPQVKWPEDLARDDYYPVRVRDSAWYECEHCRQKIHDNHRQAMLLSGQWRADSPKAQPRSLAFVISSLYSPWLGWGDMASEFVRAKPYPEKLQNFVNSWLAEPWVAKVATSTPDDLLAARTDLARGVVPDQAAVLTCGIDTQASGFWFRVRAWAPDLTSWGIDEGFLPGWQEVEELLFNTRYRTAAGIEFGIWRALIDSGGTKTGDQTISRTEEVYGWVRQHMRRGVGLWPCKGSSRPLQGLVSVPSTTIDKTPSGKSMKGWGIQVVQIDTDAAKDLFHGRLERAKQGEEQGAYLHRDTDETYIRHIMAEEKRQRRDGTVEWVQVRRQNHLLDCEVYCLACVDPALYGGIRPYQSMPHARPAAGSAPRPRPAQQQQPNPFLGHRPAAGNPYTRR